MMLQEFNKVTTTSNFIKNLLISTYLPLIRTVRDFDYIIKDRLYIYRCEVIKCTKSGYLVTGYKYFNFTGDRAQYVVQAEYHFGEKNDKLCTNYISNTEGYDALTHERLGKYLRSLRDMYDLNLMPLYNCFSNQIFQSHHIINDCIYDITYDSITGKKKTYVVGNNSKVEKSNIEYNTKVYKIPIRFNTDYTICMDNLGITTFAPAFIKNNNLMRVNNTRFENDADATNKYIKLHKTGAVTNKANLRFKEPVLIRFNNIPETKKVVYYDKSVKKLDTLHSENYYKVNTSTSLERPKYYIRNSGGYSKVEITYDQFMLDPSQYYYSDNGFIKQCTADDWRDTRIYYVADENYEYTFLPTNLVPDPEDPFYAGDTILYVGVEPSTGRIDSTYIMGRRYIWMDPSSEGNEKTLFTNIHGISYESQSKTLTIEMVGDDDFVFTLDEYTKTFELEGKDKRVFDAANFETVCLWEQCSKYYKYNPNEQYYVREDNLFMPWVFEVGLETFNQNKSFYYVKEGDNYINCETPPYDVYDPTAIYYVLYNESYITAKEYYFIIHTTDFYIILGFQESPSHYYKLVDGVYTQLSDSDEFDINTSYAQRIERELYTWRVRNGEGDLVDSTDNYIKEGVDYFARYNLETRKEYIYDITEENCALYDYLEDNLYMLIQVPKSFNANILVLEGDYTNTYGDKIIDDSQVDMLPRPMIDYLYTSKLKLMDFPTKKVIPFSNSLIEFLLWNAINNLDSINNNMDRLTIAVENLLEYNPFSVQYANYWSPDYRKVIFNIAKDRNNIPVRDNLGYVTKNIEQVLYTIRNPEA